MSLGRTHDPWCVTTRQRADMPLLCLRADSAVAIGMVLSNDDGMTTFVLSKDETKVLCAWKQDKEWWTQGLEADATDDTTTTTAWIAVVALQASTPATGSASWCMNVSPDGVLDALCRPLVHEVMRLSKPDTEDRVRDLARECARECALDVSDIEQGCAYTRRRYEYYLKHGVKFDKPWQLTKLFEDLTEVLTRPIRTGAFAVDDEYATTTQNARNDLTKRLNQRLFIGEGTAKIRFTAAVNNAEIGQPEALLLQRVWDAHADTAYENLKFVEAVIEWYKGPRAPFNPKGYFDRFRKHLTDKGINVVNDTSRWLLMKCPYQHQIDPLVVAWAKHTMLAQ